MRVARSIWITDMNTNDLQRTATTVECFLNALRLEDGRARTR